MADFWVIAHTIATELVVGALVFAGLCIFFHPVAMWWKKRASGGGVITKWAEFTEAVTDQAGFAATLFGVFALVIAAVTGSLSWSYDALAANPIVHNKIFFSAVALVTWTWVFVLRWKLGPELWQSRRSTLAYVGLAAFGFVNVAMTGAVGGHITGKGSALDALLRDVNFNSDATFALPSVLAIVLAGVGIALIGYAFMVWRGARAAPEAEAGSA
jgi:hypothetical protein